MHKLVDDEQASPLRLEGWINLLLLVLLLLAVFLPSPWREITMLVLAGASHLLGPSSARQKNDFSFNPLVEVAVIFAGVFVTMVPALLLLEQHGSALGLQHPWQFFLATGAFSSILDNAPTYLSFVSAAQSASQSPEVIGIPHRLLAAISCGAVLMGANTYIGNGPNFMVKVIAESSGYRTASFARHAVAAMLVLAPLYVFTCLWLAR
jgi:Na+/H+ antiporter NhaD/arsenite permease-like protein